MRVLSIETSSPRGSVALLDGTTLVASAEHREPKAHAERILPLIEDLLRTSGWSRSSIDRVGVGVGPGSFVGLRVGIALAEGLGLGLARPVVGVPSLRAMARAVPPEHPAARVALVDARRAEVFVTVVAPDGAELLPVRALGHDALRTELAALGRDLVVVGEVASDLALPWPVLRGPELDLPHARWVGVLAAELDPATAPPTPCYVRGAGATLPNLPPSPFQT